MKFQGAVIKEQGLTFAVVTVKQSVVDIKTQTDKALQAFQPIFPGIPVVLMAQNSRGIPTYYVYPNLWQIFLFNVCLGKNT
ncbi:hypothetical protein [Calothrix sp. UHCC 0171]|uniref:hypothetical protein n=1 Tax=Calothrix sp. UHCC 0171 TaxID=3110245 RepID=UPI002B1F114F|nr:hypothetical protein [Calothrix sp. UHCC 0171]MEA5574448.1 hypothetical protein [Calothrix sp. UHCC 0171]